MCSVCSCDRNAGRLLFQDVCRTITLCVLSAIHDWCDAVVDKLLMCTPFVNPVNRKFDICLRSSKLKIKNEKEVNTQLINGGCVNLDNFWAFCLIMFLLVLQYNKFIHSFKVVHFQDDKERRAISPQQFH